MTLAYLPSPSRGVWHLGPVPVRAYALAILLGVVVAVVIGDRRWRRRGGSPGVVADVATIGVPVAVVGARLYHVVTSPAAYLQDPVSALYVWRGGLGIPGGLLAGALVTAFVLRRRGIAVGAFGDAVAPGIAVAQAIGRFGNWFNSELFGRPTTLPWGLTIRPDNPDAVPGAVAYHPTFLYESLWDLGVAALVVAVDRRRRLGHGRAFALYVAAYATGRFWIEGLRIDPAERVLGLRLNQVTALVALLGAVVYLVARRHAGREDAVETRPDGDPLPPAGDPLPPAGDRLPPAGDGVAPAGDGVAPVGGPPGGATAGPDRTGRGG